MEEIWTGGRPASTPASSWLQAKKYSQWPSDAPNKGKMGDPVFDYFAKTELEAVAVQTRRSGLWTLSCSC